jgi:hypothetical protein
VPDLLVRRVRFVPAPPGTGLLGYASCSIVGFGHLDGLAVRCTGPDRYSVTLPARRDRSGKRHPYFRPSTRAAGEAIERAVIETLQSRRLLP